MLAGNSLHQGLVKQVLETNIAGNMVMMKVIMKTIMMTVMMMMISDDECNGDGYDDDDHDDFDDYDDGRNHYYGDINMIIKRQESDYLFYK